VRKQDEWKGAPKYRGIRADSTATIDFLVCSLLSIFLEVSLLVFRPPRSLVRSIRSFCTARATRAEACPAPRRRLLSRISNRISAAPFSFSSLNPGAPQLSCGYLRPLFRMALFRIFFLGSLGFLTRTSVVNAIPKHIYGETILKPNPACARRQVAYIQPYGSVSARFI
jgi:hypothetical protein